MESIIESIAFGIGLPLLLWLINKLLPYKLPAEAHPYTLELLRTKYARWDWVTMALVFAFAPLLGYAIIVHYNRRALRGLSCLHVGFLRRFWPFRNHCVRL